MSTAAHPHWCVVITRNNIRGFFPPMMCLHCQVGTSPNQQINPYYQTCTRGWLSSVLELNILDALNRLAWNSYVPCLSQDGPGGLATTYSMWWAVGGLGWTSANCLGGKFMSFCKQLVLNHPSQTSTALKWRGNQSRCCIGSIGTHKARLLQQLLPSHEATMQILSPFSSVLCPTFHSKLKHLMGHIWQNNGQATQVAVWIFVSDHHCCNFIVAVEWGCG